MGERTTVRLPEELLRRAKRKAAAEGRTLTALIEEGLRVVTAGPGKQLRSKRVLPPVSKETGGLMPDIDLSDSAALQELEDLEYVQRLKSVK